tara:strand:- start:121 stop:270 length:150 start_codon:yes stop_codon:yes gene_type:complete
MKPYDFNDTINLKLSKEDKQTLWKLAQSERMTLSAYARTKLFSESIEKT